MNIKSTFNPLKIQWKLSIADKLSPWYNYKKRFSNIRVQAYFLEKIEAKNPSFNLLLKLKEVMWEKCKLDLIQVIANIYCETWRRRYRRRRYRRWRRRRRWRRCSYRRYLTLKIRWRCVIDSKPICFSILWASVVQWPERSWVRFLAQSIAYRVLVGT